MELQKKRDELLDLNSVLCAEKQNLLCKNEELMTLNQDLLNKNQTSQGTKKSSEIPEGQQEEVELENK